VNLKNKNAKDIFDTLRNYTVQVEILYSAGSNCRI